MRNRLISNVVNLHIIKKKHHCKNNRFAKNLKQKRHGINRKIIFNGLNK